ncbi:restriction endonuclease subunit S [Clostridium perfringens]|nr:restriction endonuclease subunit S [Clostridium perfringens]
MEKRLIDICTPKQWKTIATKDLLEDGYPVYGANGQIGFYDKYTHEEATLMITCRGATCGSLNISRPYSYINGNAMALDNLDENIELKYLYYFLKNRGLLDTISGSAQPQITRNSLAKVIVRYPEKNLQLKIVRILDKVQELIDKRKKQIEELDLLVKSKFIEMFGDVFLNTKNFEMKQIKDIVTVVKGITYKPNQVNEEGTIVLRSSNIKGSKFDLNDIVRVNKKIDEKFLVEVNDILMCNRNGSERLVGKVAKIPEYNEPMTFGTFMTIIRTPYYNYLFTFFQTEAFRRQIKMQTSVAINQISIPLLESVKVPLPPIELQNQFADFVKQVDKLKFEMEKSLKELESNFESLMQKIFKVDLL